MSWLLPGRKFPHLDHTPVPVELVPSDCSLRYVAPPCGCFYVFLAGVGVDADDLEVEDSREEKVELAVRVEAAAAAAAAAGCWGRCPRMQDGHEPGQLLPLLSLEDEL